MPVSMTAGGATYFLLTDQVGTLRAVADSTGAIVKRVDYDSFGNIIADTNPSFSVPFGFAGGLHDRDTGLVRFGYRDYSPELGRFTAKDPLDFAGGDTNLYAYAMSDPINFVDPYGLYSWDDLLQDASNYSAGFGDTLTSGFGLSDTSLTQMIREYNGTNDVVNTCSGAYGLGKSSGYAWGAATGAGLEGQTGVLFGRGYGLLNSNDFIRLGISWKGSAKAGEEVFRLAIGKKGWPIHWHLP